MPATIYRCHQLMFVAVVLMAHTAAARATVLTFDQFTDPAKTVRTPNNSTANQAYGDNVSDFSPELPVGGQYVNYGAGGGLTPNISVQYRWYDSLNPTDPNPDRNGPGGVKTWNGGYGGLQQVVFADANGSLGGTRYLSEVQFTPEPGYQVRFNGLSLAGYLGNRENQILKIVTDANSVDAVVLLDFLNVGVLPPGDGVVFPEVGVGFDFTFFSIVAPPGKSLSVIWGPSDHSGLDNISFSQVAVPEPTTAALALVATAWLGIRAGRRRIVRRLA